MAFRLSWYDALLRIVVLTSPLWSNDFYLRLMPPGNTELRITLDFLFYIIWQTGLLFVAWRAGWFRWVDLGFETRRLWLRLLWGLGLAVLLVAGFVLLRLLAPYLRARTGFDILAGGHSAPPNLTPPLFLAWVFYLAITASLYEHVIFRGFVILQLEKAGWPTGLAVLFSAIVYTGVHWSLGPAILVLAFLAGLLWAVLYVRLRSLVPLILSHFLFDFASFYGLNDMLLRLLRIP